MILLLYKIKYLKQIHEIFPKKNTSLINDTEEVGLGNLATNKFFSKSQQSVLVTIVPLRMDIELTSAKVSRLMTWNVVIFVLLILQIKS